MGNVKSFEDIRNKQPRNSIYMFQKMQQKHQNISLFNCLNLKFCQFIGDYGYPQRQTFIGYNKLTINRIIFYKNINITVSLLME